MQRLSQGNPPGRRNLLAACVTVLSVGVLYSSFDSAPAGENVSSLNAMPDIPIITADNVPLPPAEVKSVETPENDATRQDSDTAVNEETTVPIHSALPGLALENKDAIKFCLLMLKDGARFMENVGDYTVLFHKEERINGDLKKPQAIQMKIQHKPHFAVYMKWQTGERGRQVLFSDEYEDGCMVVKFGGFKKILPALRIDPNCASAMAESRYPVTEAGIVGMIRQIQKYREADLKRTEGVQCRRLNNREFDGRDCYCFQIQYDAPEHSEVYRKNLIMIDSELHIPLIVQSYTWAEDTEGLTDEEIDQQTLIENYSFTSLNLSSKLVAIDFSRENPRYRM